MFGIKRKRPVRRPAVPGEVCICGKPAEMVFDHPAFGVEVGSCLELDATTRTGPCPFCGVTGKHITDGLCPAYTVRPAWAATAAQAALTDRGVVHHVAGRVR